MKCVCPMGGNRTCPEDCPLAIWASLEPNDRKAQRKPIAERLYKEGFTMEVIATQLGVSKMTISNDLANCKEPLQLKPAKTASNPKGAGRPKGSKAAPKRHTKTDVVMALHDQGKTQRHIAIETSVPIRQVRHVIEEEKIRRDAQNELVMDRSDLSVTAQQKFDAAIRNHQRRLMVEFETRVREEVKRRIDEIILPHWKEQIDKAGELYERRRGLMDKETFNTIRRALHPDSRQSISDKKLAEAFDAFMALEKFLLNEKDSPTELPDLPKTWEDWERAKMKAASERRAKRHHMPMRR